MKHFIFLAFIFCSAQLGAQCFPESHNTSWNEAWYSCDIANNPNPIRPAGHWIMYDFNHIYRLGKGRVWNINAPERLNDGFQNFHVDYSVDGNRWESLGVFHLNIGPGKSTYEGQELIHFSGDSARFVLLTATTNYGGECFGIAEARFEVIDVAVEMGSPIEEGCFTANIFPNPSNGDFNFSIYTECEGMIEYRLYSPMSQVLSEGIIPAVGSNFQQNMDATYLSPGLYMLYIRQDNYVKQYPLIIQ